MTASEPWLLSWVNVVELDNYNNNGNNNNNNNNSIDITFHHAYYLSYFWHSVPVD